jgi:N-methylhydantoinase B/oxoprolinase/acetone carboxylase alpha subunit
MAGSPPGGGGHGEPSGRALESVERDLLDGFIAQAHAKEYYPHVLATRTNDPDSASGTP